jgi:hypothetical protein
MASKYSGPIGSYTQAVADQSRLWLPLPTLNQAITNLKNANVATQAGRQLVLDVLASFIPAQPYAIVDGQVQLTDLRFSTSTNAGTPLTANCYVAMFRNGWEEVLTSLRAAANYSDRFTEKATTGTPTSLACTPDLARQSYNDATYALLKAIQVGQTLITNCTGIYNWHTFEAAYQLTWGTTNEPFNGSSSAKTLSSDLVPLYNSGFPSTVPPPVFTRSLQESQFDAIIRAVPTLSVDARPRIMNSYLPLAIQLGRDEEFLLLLFPPPSGYPQGCPPLKSEFPSTDKDS